MHSTERSDIRIHTLPGERYTPWTLALKLKARVILESSSFVKGKERYSILLVKPAFTLIQRAGLLFLDHGHGEEVFRLPESSGTAQSDILDACAYFAAQQPALMQDLPFPAGGVGFLSYGFASYCDTCALAPREDPDGLPEAAFLFGHVFAIFDHCTDIIYLIGLNYREAATDLERELVDIERRLNDMDFSFMAEPKPRALGMVVQANGERERFMDGVLAIKRQIEEGNLLQAVLSRRVVVETELSALEAYRSLRSSNPSPYLFYLDFGAYRLFGSSPEVQVKVKDGVAELKPIAGTRRRSCDKTEDARLEAELMVDPKEKAEHLMLVDLARNDLGRVCERGSVRVSEFMRVERFSHVMHLVSRVEGRVRVDASAQDVVRATFPAGTVSGAPKLRAMKTVDALEPYARSFYAGLVGYFEPGGGMDSCITIRAGLEMGGRVVLQAGAGVVYDSDPGREYEETCEKLRALALAAGVEA